MPHVADNRSDLAGDEIARARASGGEEEGGGWRELEGINRGPYD